jgi:hypothetical protein
VGNEETSHARPPLPQLHTLRGVNLCVVSVAAIASALPRLHTVEFVVHDDDAPPTAVVGFFELLPAAAGVSLQWPVATR